MSNNLTTWQNEWQILHNDHEVYERYALMIKLIAINLCAINLIFNLSLVLAIPLLLILWLQEGIWKTYQNRTASRLLWLEKHSVNQHQEDFTAKLFKFYSVWQAQKPNSLTLIKEYLTNTLKPTIMYPYLVLVLLNVVAALL